MSLAIILSIIATVLSVASFSGTVWRTWRDRPRLLFYVTPMTFTNVPKVGELKMLRVMISNVGYRPIMLTRFMGFGEKSSFTMGIDDEPAAMFGQDDQKFPTLLAPGETLKIHPISIAAMEQNSTKPDNVKKFYDPWKYFGVIDSFNRIHPIEVEMVRFHLRMLKKYVHPKWWQRPSRWIARCWFLRRARKGLKRDF